MQIDTRSKLRTFLWSDTVHDGWGRVNQSLKLRQPIMDETMTTGSTVLPPSATPIPVEAPPSTPVPPSEPEWPTPKLVFVVEDMATPGGVRVFRALKDPAEFLQMCINNICKLLYTKKSVRTK